MCKRFIFKWFLKLIFYFSLGIPQLGVQPGSKAAKYGKFIIIYLISCPNIYCFFRCFNIWVTVTSKGTNVFSVEILLKNCKPHFMISLIVPCALYALYILHKYTTIYCDTVTIESTGPQ